MSTVQNPPTRTDRRESERYFLNLLAGFKRHLPDADPQETAEWLGALDDIVRNQGPERAEFLLRRVLRYARQLKVGIPGLVQSRYINTISPEQEPPFPGDESMELRIRRIIRWNAAVMVLRANKHHAGIGGHLSTYASSASLYEVGFNHFFQGKDAAGGGDQIFFQGHAAPGIYARAFLEGRLTESQLEHFRRESRPGQGLSSYPHPRLMPEFWEFPTVSMGLGPINAIYQARFNRYLHARGFKDTSNQRVWAYLGDGEMDEPEATGALRLAGTDGLDNLTFVINCNLQRLDGPVRGNGKIIQELEALFTGCGWNVIKVIWASEWDPLLARDVEGALVDRMNETVDGDWQKYIVESGGYIREHFFGADPRLLEMVSDMDDDAIKRLRRGGHDYRKIYAAYHAATNSRGRPTVILAKTVKGWTLGTGAEARNISHQMKKLDVEELKKFRDRLELSIPDKKLADPPYFHPGASSAEVEYLLERRRALGGSAPRRVVRARPLPAPQDKVFTEFFTGTREDQAVSTTMVFAKLLRNLVRDANWGRRVVPIIPDEARTFGLEVLFREIGIYAAFGQKYEPVDSKLVLSYLEKVDGQLLEEGITEAGSMASFTAAGTSYATHGEPMIPFYIFYSMFGLQRTGDFSWAFGDARGRGFMLGATAGRTTLNGEGLQHEDGHSPVLSSTVPNLLTYDPAYAYELATIIRDGLTRMYVNGEDVFYYLTLYNQDYPMPSMPSGCEDGILKGLYLYRSAVQQAKHRAQLLGSGVMMPEALRAQEMLATGFDVAADVWSVTSYGQLRNEALDCERWNRLHPGDKARVPYVTRTLADSSGPIVAVTDYMKSVPDMISRWVPHSFLPLGTDGFGRSDTRQALRRHFETDAEHVVVAVLSELLREGRIAAGVVERAIREYGFDTESAEPRVR
ncbi:MAG: pyruvate dehydrogenase (acetyl-transferring), homodimeric type [Candidatus Eisenbacteria bacterium]|uniref:Pyruvate dehydrogenase E1 component n=1 Tax=Eiseniibacteriota bacterium TaxID=2212470 RepID=A0A849SWU6_UNCEI|nr:pyruvate dehydrogenase (acetyl-transferring), homodimeric type [Candidatus Eisenbacteria bacterium]